MVIERIDEEYEEHDGVDNNGSYALVDDGMKKMLNRKTKRRTTMMMHRYNAEE